MLFKSQIFKNTAVKVVIISLLISITLNSNRMTTYLQVSEETGNDINVEDFIRRSTV